jgi:uncharacterized protein YkwD
MPRVVASLFLALILPACSYTPSSSVFASLSDTAGQAPEPKREVAPIQKTAQEEEEKSTVGNIWDSVKSGLSMESTTKTTVPANAPITELDPNVAQQLINEYRAQKGLKPLRLNPKLSEAANAHSLDLAKSDRISHYGSDGSDTWERVKRAGYRARLTAENVGTGQRSINEVFEGWQNSRDHNANLLLADANEMGIAMVHKPDTQFKTFWTLVLGARN